MGDEVWWPGTDGLWHRKGWAPVAPGQRPVDPTIPPDEPPPPPPTPTRRLYRAILEGNGIPPGPGPGPGDPPPGMPYALDAELFGACVRINGGTGAAGANDTINIFGPRCSIRQFGTNSAFTASRGSSGSITHGSYNQSAFVDTATIAGQNDAAFRAIADRYNPGDIVTSQHESDLRGLTGTTFQNRVNAISRFHDVIHDYRPEILTCVVFAASFFGIESAYPGSAQKRIDWAGVRADLVGYDFDGVHDRDTDTTRYDALSPNYIATLFDWMDNRTTYQNWRGWCFPEFGTTRRPWDTTGSFHLEWTQRMVDGYRAYNRNPYTVQWFNYNDPLRDGNPADEGYYELQDTRNAPQYLVLNYWKARVAENPAPAPLT